MLLPAFQDLIKPQWRAVLEALKRHGELPISELAAHNQLSYMGAKAHCEALQKAGYLVRTRLPPSGVGRPEILYSLSAKADLLFVRSGPQFTLDLLEDTKRIFGESTPDKLLFQHFSRLQKQWADALGDLAEPAARATKLAKLRSVAGHGCFFVEASGEHPAHLLELHNPLHEIFLHYPRAATMELRMLEELLECRLKRRVIETGREAPAHLAFDLPRIRD